MAKTTARRAFRAGRPALVAAALLVLAACKGGGPVTSVLGPSYNNPNGAPAPVSTGVMTAFFAPAQGSGVASAAAALLNTTQYLRQNTPSWSVSLSNGVTLSGLSSQPLGTSGAAFAHAAGLSGSGARVGIVDTYLNISHEALSHITWTAFNNGTQAPADQGWNDHGTQVASIIAGASPTFIGTAPATSLDFDSFETMTNMTNATLRAAAGGYVAQNNSWGYDSLDISGSSFDTIFTTANGAAYLSALDLYASQGVVVFAMSNDNTKVHATLMDALPWVRPGLEAGWIAVGNAVPTMSGSNVQSVRMISADCMEAARWCILADGAWDGASSLGVNTYSFGTGTSYAAPQVSGALALLSQAFPTLTPHELRVRLLASADNDFFTPDATVELATGYNKGFSYRYGHGFLDIEAALKPIGPTQMSLPDGTRQTVGQPLFVAGSAMGDAVARSLHSVDVAVSDVLNAPFRMQADALATSVAPPSTSARLLARAMTTDLAVARTAPEVALDNAFASFASPSLAAYDPSRGLTAEVMMSPGDDGDFGLSVSQLVGQGPTQLEVGLKMARDSGSMMGFGAGGDAAAAMMSVELGMSQDLGGDGFLTLAGEFGLADLGTDSTFAQSSSASYNAMTVEFGKRNAFTADDRLALTVGLPVVVTGGSATAVLPVANSLGHASYAPVAIDLSPQDRQLDIGLTYQTPVTDDVELMAQLLHSDNFGNVAGATDTGALLALSFRF